MPHPGHLCVANDCRFHLNTYVGGYIVSTVGEYWPDSEIRKINAKISDISIQGKGDEWNANYMKQIGYEDIGFGRKYETMVFKATKTGNKCCPWGQSGWELDFEGYNDPSEACKGHLKFCNKWSKKSR